MYTIWFWQKLVQPNALFVVIKIYNKIGTLRNIGQSVSFFVCKDFINI